MENICINDVDIKIKQFVKIQEESGIVFITDSEIESEQFDAFLNLYKKYNSKGNYFNVVIDNQNFYGRFGQLVYSKGETIYQLRLVLVESLNDSDDDSSLSSFVLDGVEYQNMRSKIKRQELIIDRLISLLVEKEIIIESDVNHLKTISEEEIKEVKFKLATEVKDLDEYLESMNDRLKDIMEQ